MFRICRVFVAFVFCAFCVGVAYAANTNSGPTRTVNASGIETGYSGAQSGGGMNDKLCVGKKNGDSCSDNTKTGTCQIQKNNGKNVLTCVRKSCRNENGYYLSYYKDATGRPTRSKGICRHESFCKSGYELKKHTLNGITITTDDCVKSDNKCTDSELGRLNAQTGINHELNRAHTQDLDKNTDVICMPIKCVSGYVLEHDNTDDAVCVPCQSCSPTHANCEMTGSDGLKKCQYKTSCETGYGNEQNAGKYNPSCSANEYKITLNLNGGTGCDSLTHKYGVRTTIDCQPTKAEFVFDGWCTSSDLTDPQKNRVIDATDMGDKTFYAKWTKSGCASLPNVVEFDAACNPTKCVDKYILQNGKCVACASCNPGANARCELTSSDGQSRCNYRTWCEPGFVPDENENSFNPTCKAGDSSAITNQASPEQEATEDEVYAINYNLGGGTGCDNAPKNYIVGQQFTVDCEPRRSGYVFEGWCVGADCVNPQRTFMFDKNNGGKKTLIAKWKSATKPRTECNDSEKAQFPNADRFEFVGGKCRPVHCARGYRLENGACVDDGIRAAEEEYASARENEMSLKNRLMSGATIGATGIGGMQLASGIAEQSADAAAAADMAAYTQKMQCGVSDRRYRFNEKSVNVGGENALMGLYSEYVALADDLHERKDALGYAPGIESAVVFKREYTGLYDDVGSGVQNGTYASLYRASIGNENDISRIADDATNTQNRIDTGLGAVGIGAAGGTMGNILGNYVDFNKSESE